MSKKIESTPDKNIEITIASIPMNIINTLFQREDKAQGIRPIKFIIHNNTRFNFNRYHLPSHKYFENEWNNGGPVQVLPAESEITMIYTGLTQNILCYKTKNEGTVTIKWVWLNGNYFVYSVDSQSTYFDIDYSSPTDTKDILFIVIQINKK